MYVYRRRLYTAAQSILDVLSFWLIWPCAAELRILLNPLTARQLSWETAAVWVPSRALVLLLWIAVSVRLRLYRAPDEIRPGTMIRWIAENAFVISTLAVLATFFSQQFGAGASRLFVLCLALVTVLVLAATRCLALALVAALQQRGQPPRIALVGDIQHAKRLISSLESRIAKAIRGVIVPETALIAAVGHSVPVLGTTGQIAELVNRERIDHAIIMNRSLPDSEVEHCRKILWRMGLPVSYALDLPRELRWAGDSLRWHPRLELSREHGLSTVEVRAVTLTGTQDLVKRVFDVGLAAWWVLLLGPAMLLIAALVKLASRGPVFERTLHVGKGGRHFNCLKFRTTAGKDGAGRDPAHLTRIGRFLLRYRMDELPQLANILRGKMKFVGPAPLPVEILETTALRQESAAVWAETRSLVPPGLTGLWQVSASTLSFPEMQQLDLEYIQTRSGFMDLRILLSTPTAVFRGVRAAEYPRSRFVAGAS